MTRVSAAVVGPGEKGGTVRRALRYLGRAARDLSARRSLVESNVFSGTTTYRDCLDAVRTIVRGHGLTEGPFIARYEEEFARTVGCPTAVSFAAGRMALFSILEALDIGPGDEVIVPAFTCVVVPNAILYRGARPVYADIDRGTFNVDVSRLEEKISPRTRAILAQHTFGLPCDVNTVRSIASKHGIVVIEDWAHALGAIAPRSEVGERRILFFSTDHTKVISTLTGGMVATDDDALATRLRQIQRRSSFLPRGAVLRIVGTLCCEHVLMHPRIYWLGKHVHFLLARLGVLHFFRDELYVSRPGGYPYPARLSNVQARIGLNQLAALRRNVEQRRRLARLYSEALGPWSEDAVAPAPTHAFLRYSFLVSDRAAFQRALRGMLDMGVWYTTIAGGREHDTLQEIQYQPGSCPNGEFVAAHVVNLPTHFRVPNAHRLARLLRQLRWDPDSGTFALQPAAASQAASPEQARRAGPQVASAP